MADPDSRDGSTYTSSPILDFVDSLYHQESETMLESLQAIAAQDLPRIQVGPGDGALLALLLRLIGAERVVEIGTLTGYSALWMLRGLREDGRIWTFEADPVAAAQARRVFEQDGADRRVTVIEGPAAENLSTIESSGPFDAVFIDADKGGYPAYASWGLDNVRSGGLLLADNAYLFGYLAGREPSQRAGASDITAMRRFHQLLAERCTHATVIPTPDGMAVGVVP
jgi:caffeoyl-CoA O-methyltransferase